MLLLGCTFLIPMSCCEDCIGYEITSKTISTYPVIVLDKNTVDTPKPNSTVLHPMIPPLTDDLEGGPVLAAGQEILREVVELAAAEVELPKGEVFGVQRVEGVRVHEREAGVVPVSR